LSGAGAPNALCAGYTPKDPDPTENARSVGMLITYGRFRMIDLGDLTWNKEHDLACPNNLVGTVDLYLTTHHGMNISGVPAVAHAQAGKVYELRTYTAPEGKLGDLHARFRNHTTRIFDKHGMKSVAYFSPQDAPLSQNTLIYILEHPSRDDAKKHWAEFSAD